MERMRTNTGPPEPSHPFTTNCDTTRYVRRIFLSNHEVHFVNNSHNLGGTEPVRSFRLHSAYPIAAVWKIITSTNEPQRPKFRSQKSHIVSPTRTRRSFGEKNTDRYRPARTFPSLHALNLFIPWDSTVYAQRKKFFFLQVIKYIWSTV